MIRFKNLRLAKTLLTVGSIIVLVVFYQNCGDTGFQSQMLPSVADLSHPEPTPSEPTPAQPPTMISTPPPTAPSQGDSTLFKQSLARVWVDPQIPFSEALSYSTTDPKGALLLNYLYPYYQPNLPGAQSIGIQGVPSAGLMDPNDTTGNKFRFGIVTDETGRRVIRMRYVKGQGYITLNNNPTHRYLLTYDSRSDGGDDIKHIPFEEDTWIAYAYRAPSKVYRGKVEDGTGNSCGDNVVGLGGVSTSRAGNSSIYIYLRPNNGLSFSVNHNSGTTRSTWKESGSAVAPDIPSGEWAYIVMKVRLNYQVPSDETKKPYTKIWVQSGNNASLNQVMNSSAPNAWAPTPASGLYPYSIIRAGTYFWCTSRGPDMWTPMGASDFHMDIGGIYVIPANKVPGATEADVLALLKK